jgi:hypothetical protein
MSQRILFFNILLLCYVGCFGQTNQDIVEFNQNRKHITELGMITLGSWAIGNMAVNGLLMRIAEDQKFYFYQMNTIWNAVNLAIAGLGYYSASKIQPESLDLAGSAEAYYTMGKILLFNAGLDLAYIVGGLYLKERSKNVNNKPERLAGYGNAVILQGAFLFAFDVTLYFVLNRQHDKLNAILQNVSIISGNGLGLAYHF